MRVKSRFYMGKSVPKYFCNYCDKKTVEKDRICPHCGCDLKKVGRKIKLTVEGKISLLGGLTLKQKKKGIVGHLVYLKNRTKISSKTKKLTRENLLIDRTDTTKTVKRHHVEEWDDKEKRWIVVHDEQEEFKAKRRKKVDKNIK